MTVQCSETCDDAQGTQQCERRAGHKKKHRSVNYIWRRHRAVTVWQKGSVHGWKCHLNHRHHIGKGITVSAYRPKGDCAALLKDAIIHLIDYHYPKSVEGSLKDISLVLHDGC